MRHRRVFMWAAIAALFANVFSVAPVPAQQGTNQTIRAISRSGTSEFHAATAGSGATQAPEFPGSLESEDIAGGGTGFNNPITSVNRSQSHGNGVGSPASSARKAKSNPEISVSFDGLNMLDQRVANGGKQFSVEPPDQGLCVGNGYVLESVNDVLQVFDTSGNPVTGVVDLNTFYGYPAQFDRNTGLEGPFVTDPSCLFDTDTQRFYQVVLTLEVDPATGAFLGPNHLDIAVSQTADPTGAWTIYRLPVQDDGSDGTPDHQCAGGPCIGDFPHIGADKYGFYITTNEYPFFDDGFHGAQIYAFSKTALAGGGPSVKVVQIDTAGMVAGNPGFTVWPATSPGNGNYAVGQGGTEYFLSSTAAEEANGNYVDNRLAVWALTNSKSLNSPNPSVKLGNTIITVNQYALPPLSDQKAGPFPLGECINDTTADTPYGPGCWQYFFLNEPLHDATLPTFDSSDTRILTTTYAQGKLWGALDTAVTVNGVTKAGIAWYIISPQVSGSGVPKATVAKEGYFAVDGNNVTFPAIGVTTSGRGVMAFTISGQDYYPSAGYVSIDAKIGVGDMHVAAEGLGPDDGFTGYGAIVGYPPRTRWGDYGAAAVDGNTVWLASEYIGQSCTLEEYLNSGLTCGGTRAPLGNWGTRITKVKP